MYGKKILVLEDNTDKYDEHPTWDVAVREVSGVELAKLLAEGISFYNCPIVAELLKHDSFRNALKRQGWIDAAQIARIEEKGETVKRFYILEQNRNGFRGYDVGEVDLEKMLWHEADKLAPESSQILQVISKASLKKINPKAYKEYLEAKKRLEARETKNKKAQEKRAATKKAKKLAEAKQLLESERKKGTRK